MSGPLFGLRRDPPRDPDEVGEDAELVARIRGEIAARGPVTFARFMERALYEPDHGYYRRPVAGPGREGDFLTAPETDPIFGAALSRVLHETWHATGQPDRFVVAEHGAGTGSLAEAILDGLRHDASPLLEAIVYRPVEVEPARLAALQERLAGSDLARHVDTSDSGPVDVVLANEVLDALPVHRVVQRATLRERYVGLDGERLVELEGQPSTDALAAHLAADGVVLAEDLVTEIPLAADTWLAAAAARVERGLVLLVDYGAEAADLHGPARPQGSLRTFARHTLGDDPLVRIGRQDLTSHVCLTGIRRAAAAAALDPVAETTQAELLAATDVGELVARRLHAAGTSLETAFGLRSALARLLDPRVMGGYHVLGFGRGLPPGWRPSTLRRLARGGRG